MFGTVLDKVSGRLDQRFLGTLLFPGFLFLTGVGAFVATDVGWARTLTWWSSLDGSRRALLVTAAVAGIVLFGLLLAARLRAMVQFFEGYWPEPFAELGRRRQERRLARTKSYERRYYLFPASSFMPTRLGNVLRAAEDYPGAEGRYGMDGVFFWPRLYAVLPDGMRALLADSRADLERLLVICVNAGLFAVVALGFAIFGDVPVAVWLPSSAGTVLLAVLSYRGAVRAALAYGDLVRTAFDVHRRDLLVTMGLELPTTLAAERTLWTALGQQLYRGVSDHPEVLRFKP